MIKINETFEAEPIEPGFFENIYNIGDMDRGDDSIIIAAGLNTDTPQEIKLTPEGFFYNGRFITEDKELYEKFKAVTNAVYLDYKENNLI